MNAGHLPSVMLICLCEQEELKPSRDPIHAAAPSLLPVGSAGFLGCADAVMKDVLG